MENQSGSKLAPQARRRAPRVGAILLVMGAIFLLFCIVSILTVEFSGSQRASNVRSTSASLKTLATAEADFRANDRDGNRVQDFWTGDVSQLYGLTSTAMQGTNPLKLIDIGMAGADSFPMGDNISVSDVVGPGPATTTGIGKLTQQGPWNGYWYEALTADNGSPGKPVYRTITDGSMSATKNNLRYGFVAWPDSIGTKGRLVYIINEDHIIFKRQPLSSDVLPTNPGMIPPGPIQIITYANWPTDKQLIWDWERMD